jgi:hypothetical protein
MAAENKGAEMITSYCENNQEEKDFISRLAFH